MDRINDVRIRETVLQETAEPKEPQAQDHISPEAEPMVHASPDYKSELIAERRLGGQTQEMLLRNQLNESEAAAQTNQAREPKTFTRDSDPVIDLDKTPMDEFKDMLKKAPEQIPAQLKSTAEAVVDAWSHPGDVVREAAENAGQIWTRIKEGK